MRIAIFQLTSQLDPACNMQKIEKAAREVKWEGAEALFLPECFYSMSDGITPTPHLVSRENRAFKEIQNIAAKNQIYLLGGSVAYDRDGTVVNRALNFNPRGELISFYDKRHLFACDFLRDGKRKKINEGDLYQKGEKIVVDHIGDLKIGYGICFDLRFPVQSWELREKGANLLTYASAFTVPTGKAHWHILLRARAIEGQCFVIAAAQWGRHNSRLQSFGHSLAVDPWGEILCDLGEGEKWKLVDLDLDKALKVRRQIRVYRNLGGVDA